LFLDHFWSEFRAAVEHIVRDFNTAVGQSPVELSPGQKNVSSLGVRAGSTHLRANIDSDSKLRIEQPSRVGVAGKLGEFADKEDWVSAVEGDGHERAVGIPFRIQGQSVRAALIAMVKDARSKLG
jgi:hypothetical protein